MFAFWSPGPTELIILLIVALLLFGKRLPEVARSLGKGIVEFKRGVRGIEDEIDTESLRQLPLPEEKPEPTPAPDKASERAEPSEAQANDAEPNEAAKAEKPAGSD